MGNCVFKGEAAGGKSAAASVVVKVTTPGGGVMELQPPVAADTITNEFPGYAIFSDEVPPPLLHDEHLRPGQSYHLRPLCNQKLTERSPGPYRLLADHGSSTPTSSSSRRHPPVADRKAHGRGVWKVRLAINSDQLSEILSQEARTEALIESVRTVAKCAGRSKGVVPCDQRGCTSWPGPHSTDA